jgi:hypothetical protein
MKVRAAHIFSAIAALSFLVGCSCSKPKVISKGKLAEIYAEMLVMDQWIADNPGYRLQADTSLVYEPIFEKFGYTTEDYRASVEHYMNDPERYSKILRSTTEILDAKLVELKELKRIEDRRKAIVPYEIDRYRLYYMRSVDRLWETGDSLCASLDSLTPVYEICFYETSDTLYDGLNLVVRKDSVVRDSVIAEPSVVVEEETFVKPVPVQKPDSVVAPAPEVGKLPKKRLLTRTLDSLRRK